jgi:hypothetical protein
MKKRRRWVSAAARRLVEASSGCTSVDQAVAQVAKRLLDGIQCPPTDLQAVAQRLSVVRFRPEQLPVAGELRCLNGQLEIVYAAGMPRGRRRFTIAHELGHAFFEQTGPGFPRSGGELEDICDLIAAELLMPRWLIPQVLGSPPGLEGLLDVISAFDVSRQAAAYRCCELAGLHAFEVDRLGKLSFTTGLVRDAGLGFSEAIESVLAGNPIDVEVHLDTSRFMTAGGRWRLQGKAIGKGDRAFFAMWPARRSR